jgi:hypothetical protein
VRLDEARGLLMQALREAGWNQVSNLVTIVGNYRARSQGITPRGYEAGRQFLDPGDEQLLLESIWALIIQGVLVPGLAGSNQGYPFLVLTEYGKRCLEENQILPHDPDGYLREFHKAIPNVDSTITEYLTEGLQCYLRGLNRAAAVMLGGASEQAILLLIESYVSSMGDIAARERIKSEIEDARTIFTKYALFERHFSPIKRQMPDELKNNVDSQLRGVFDLIRGSRNDAGHPAGGIQIGRDAIYSHLCLFAPYCQRIYGLIDWFSNNQI